MTREYKEIASFSESLANRITLRTENSNWRANINRELFRMARK